MRLIIQRVTQASVTVDNKIIAKIKQGFLIYFGIHKEDKATDCNTWIDKIIKLRIFADDHKPINRSIQDIDGEILFVSQFTLYADCKEQNRPSFTDAAPPAAAKEIYDEFVKQLKIKWPKTQTGEFAADMQVSSINDGPVTIIME